MSIIVAEEGNLGVFFRICGLGVIASVHVPMPDLVHCTRMSNKTTAIALCPV